MQHARDLQAQKDTDISVKQQQKQAQKAHKEVEKMERAQKVEEQKAIRANIKEDKLRKQAKKRQQKDEAIQAKQASQQLNSELIVRAKKVPKPIEAQKQSDTGCFVDLVVVEDGDPPIPRNTRGRQIRRPKRYQQSM